jgi:tRNA(adenine34) deaminase
MNSDLFWMKNAISIATHSSDEFPVGCIIVKDNIMIASSYNKIETLHDPTAHSEMLCIKQACKFLNCRYLCGCIMYITLEPCPMCEHAIQLARIDKVVFGAFQKAFSLHKNEVIGGILEEECTSMMNEFYKNKR